MDATELAREREAAAERTEKRRREEFVLVRAGSPTKGRSRSAKRSRTSTAIWPQARR